MNNETGGVSRRSVLTGIACIVPFAHASRTCAQGSAGTRRFSITDFGAVPGTDALPAVRQALAMIGRNGGGTLVFPANGGMGWRIDGQVLIVTDHTHVHLYEDVILNADSPASAFLFSGKSTDAPVVDVSIRGIGARRVIDGQGSRFLSYKYSTSDTYYSCVLFRWCENWSADNIYGKNGLVNCLRAFQCGGGVFRNCAASHSVYDNGISIDFNLFTPLTGVSPAQRIVDCQAWNCTCFGMTAYAASNVQMVNPRVVSCGNDDPHLPVSGGGISIEGDYRNAQTAGRNRTVTISNAVVHDCYNAGIFITARDVRLVRPHIANTIAAKNRGNAMLEKGSAIYCIAAAQVTVVSASITQSGTNGVTLVDNHGYAPSIDFDGNIDGSRLYQIFVFRRANVIVKNMNKVRVVQNRMLKVSYLDHVPLFALSDLPE